MKKKYCMFCGANLTEPAIFCIECGKKQSAKEKTGFEDSKLKKAKHNKAYESKLDNWIKKLELIPEEYRKELTRGLIRSLGPSKMKLACICLIYPKDHFKIQLDENIKIKVRFLTTETHYDRPIIAAYIKIFDSEAPGIDEHFHARDKHLKRMIGQDYTYLIIADPMYNIYFRRKIVFDRILKEDLNKIKKAFERYGERDGKITIGEDPKYLYAMQWYQNNMSLKEIDRKYFQ